MPKMTLSEIEIDARDGEASELSPAAGPTVSIVIPAFNEAAAIGGVVRDLKSRYPLYEIVAVDDGSTDDTASIARAEGARVIRLPVNRGYGGALKTGIASCTGDIVVWFDADGQFDPEDVERFVTALTSSDLQLVAGARGRGSHVTTTRRPGKMILKLVANLISGMEMPDVNCGLRAFRRETLLPYLSLLPDSYSASLTSTILFAKLRHKIEFIPVKVSRRVGSSSVRQVRDGPRTMLLAVRLMALFDPLRIFLPVALTVMGISMLYSIHEALTKGLGVPVLGATGFLVGLVFFFMGLICDQLSALRLEVLQRSWPSRNAPGKATS